MFTAAFLSLLIAALQDPPAQPRREAVPLRRVTSIAVTRWRCAVAFSPDGRRLAVTETDGGLRLFDTMTWKSERPTDTHVSSPAAFSPDGKTLAISYGDNRIALFDMLTWKARQIAVPQGDMNAVTNFAWSHDGIRLAVISDGDALPGEERTVRLWNAATWEALEPLTVEHRAVALAWSPTDDTLAVRTNGAIVLVQNVAAERKVRTIESPCRGFAGIAFRNDGAEVAANADDPFISVWDVHSARLVRSMKAESGHIMNLKWTPDGRTFVSTSDKILRIWDADTGAALVAQTLPEVISDLSIAPDGLSIVTKATDVEVWSLPKR